MRCRPHVWWGIIVGAGSIALGIKLLLDLVPPFLLRRLLQSLVCASWQVGKATSSLGRTLVRSGAAYSCSVPTYTGQSCPTDDVVFWDVLRLDGGDMICGVWSKVAREGQAIWGAKRGKRMDFG